MPKRKELPRKRKRFWKRVLFFASFLAVLCIVAAGAFYYYYFIKPHSTQLISAIPVKTVVQADQTDNTLVELKSALSKAGVGYTSITKEKDDSFKVVLQKGGEVTFSSQKDIMSQIASLQYILSHLTMEGKLFSQLDLRFEKPVIKLRE